MPLSMAVVNSRLRIESEPPMQFVNTHRKIYFLLCVAQDCKAQLHWLAVIDECLVHLCLLVYVRLLSTKRTHKWQKSNFSVCLLTVIRLICTEKKEKNKTTTNRLGMKQNKTPEKQWQLFLDRCRGTWKLVTQLNANGVFFFFFLPYTKKKVSTEKKEKCVTAKIFRVKVYKLLHSSECKAESQSQWQQAMPESARQNQKLRRLRRKRRKRIEDWCRQIKTAAAYTPDHYRRCSKMEECVLLCTLAVVVSLTVRASQSKRH